MAVPLREAGGGEGLPLRRFFLFIFYYHFKKFKYFTLDNLSGYGYITLKLVGRYFYWLVTIFAEKYGSFSPKIGGRKKCPNPFPAILRIKNV